MIELRGVGVRAGRFELKNVSLTVRAGEYVALMGRSGQGKTTLLEVLCGLRRVSAGSVWLNGRCVTQEPPAARGVGYVPQDLALFPTMTVREHLEFALRLRRTATEPRVPELAARLEISGLLDRNIRQLSGGEAQRVALGRALSFRPAVLLLDEPLSALDDVTRDGMYRLLKSLHAESKMTVLHVTHSRRDAESLAGRVLLLDEGRIREET
jgi:ABC-type sugar transport system ATPase subunit